ncbi:MAG: hypothetical protein BMS9Abin05_2667 [Rhodothermia bacterium]|nr:MAG: hypothetical protein BMS9Abin05_2667 [Rhodothermia bacterium]
MGSFTDRAKIDQDAITQKRGREALVQWVMEHVLDWERWRQRHFDHAWASYRRKWRGLSTTEDKARKNERSNMVVPALQEAIEDAVSEFEEATIGAKEAWFDLADDVKDQQQEDWQALRQQVLDDMDMVDMDTAIAECGFNGALYGTMIGKIIVDEVQRKVLAALPLPDNKTIQGVASEEAVVVRLEPVRPDQFVIDTAVNRPGKAGIDMALGMAHRVPRPVHIIQALQHDEIEIPGQDTVPATYYETPLTKGDLEPQGEVLSGEPTLGDETTLITEYHGKVPRLLLEAAVTDSMFEEAEINTNDMVEAIITIADDEWLLKAVENDSLKTERAFVASPYDLVPGSFWGRGVAEKSFNSQRMLDAMARAKLDGLAITVHPMLGVDQRRLSPRYKVQIGAGKILRSNGPPNEVFQPMRFGNIDTTVFSEMGELERFVHTAAGTAGSQSPLRTSRTNETVGGMSLSRGNIVKRTKRMLRLVERNFLKPLIEKFILRQMEYNSDAYPFQDLRFRVRTTMGMVAREVENSQLSQLMGYIPPESPVFFAVLSQIIDNMGAKDKGVVQQALQQQMQQAQQGPSEEEQFQQKLTLQREMAELAEIVKRTELKDAQIAEKISNIQSKLREGDKDGRE